MSQLRFRKHVRMQPSNKLWIENVHHRIMHAVVKRRAGMSWIRRRRKMMKMKMMTMARKCLTLALIGPQHALGLRFPICRILNFEEVSIPSTGL